MSRKRPKIIALTEAIKTEKVAFKSKVVKSGNGAVIPFFKQFIGRDATVIIKNLKKENQNEERI